MTPMKFLMGAVVLGALTAGCSVEAPTGATTQHLSTAQCNAFEVGGRIVICHATGSARNPISIIRVSEAACINAHSDHPGDYVAVDGNCGPDACLPETAPCDATLRCCDGLTCSAGACVNIDACATNACGANATCTDLPAPALGDASGRTCACNAGYQGDGITCTDIDACATNACGANATCTDLAAPAPGDASGRTCACNAGYEGDGTTCTDINACAANPCDANATCTDLAAPAPGDASGRTCACNPGYEGDGTTCTDINECAVNNGGCSANATCTNTVGSFTCSCNSGYEGDGSACSDVNECAVNNGGCSANATCTNNAGAPPTCACNTGYTGNGVTCTAAATPSGQVCQGGTDPHTGAAYVICRNYGNRLWISGNVGGRYHIDQVCQALGWRTAGRWDGTCGNVCGYCQGPTSCTSPGNEVLGRPFMPNNCGSDAYGPLWCNTIQWECIL